MAANTSQHSDESSESFDLMMEAGSSSFEEMEDNVPLGTQPYLFEPEASSDEEINQQSSPESTDEDRLGNTDWCSCGNCPPMSTIEESVCCHEIPQVMTVLEEDPGKPCIIEHNGFEPVCLHPSSLRTAYYNYRQHYDNLPESNQRMRYIGYRQLARWCWGWLGKHVRVPLPACAVQKIRNTYPAEDGVYQGFNMA